MGMSSLDVLDSFFGIMPMLAISLSLLNGKWFSLMYHCMILLLCLFVSLICVGGLSNSKLNGVIGSIPKVLS